ncbi:aminotransferase class I/II-fold pyridoxal phosphate-dependent enzyme [Arsenicicoccus piscis]|uniref:UDP-4-amino-4, 6-dideoxy-N-acetyl-beta-L-altrosami ne transaminase n=1 Tax=Arsenicicoccus piscis TaxID=673954 RepID=A0ABQ6HPP4_9MICO|nr:aminotransferase class I/II-fold pyridoxal phosphate-dependent enzyme [Arsenicicoccus piscis]MCH8629098.1 aminotransferase class I/II-fold pyridoxal phosphate-dependent enzyme [Arsenicicoccus piscis]GMA20346.1 UDP-4-amino-4,6-dideoxy-N-acetyl-beta-L-altrosami ne transaminase [Arsenicicoccus piscis]
MLPYGRQSIDESDIEAVAQVLRGDWLTTGPAVAAFERDVADVAGVPTPAVAVTSGTAALHVAYAAAGVGPGDQVITTPLTFLATATCAAILGAEIVFADVSPDTGNLDPASVADKITDRTKVVAGVDYGGHPIDAPGLREVIGDRDILLLEDAAHSVGGSLDGTPVGSLADLTTFSFFPTKNLTTAEGGAVVGLDPEVVARARTFKGIGMVREPDQLRVKDEGAWWYEMPELGLNYRLPDVLAALGSNQMKRLAQFKERRQAITDRYNEGLAGLDELILPTRRPGAEPVWHLYPLRIRDGRRRALFDHLRASGIGVQVNYIPVYWQPWFADRGYERGLCPVAETYYEGEISLPMYPDLTDQQVDQVIGLIRDFVTHQH